MKAAVEKGCASSLRQGSGPDVLVSAGEVSGDRIGAWLAAALREICPGISMVGVGGMRMAAAGVAVIQDTNPLGSVGISEPLATIPELWKTFGKLRSLVGRQKPAVAVLIGHEFFHLILARWLRARGVFTIAYFPPQVWLWRGIAGIIARSYDLILASFPEEYAVYRKAGGRVEFVGHYLAGRLEERIQAQQPAAREELGLSFKGRVIGLFPGSRLQEVRGLLPIFLAAFQRLRSSDPEIQGLVAVADSVLENEVERVLSSHRHEGQLHLVRDSRLAMAASDLLLLCSGTATLEAALMGVPMIIVNRVSRISWLVVKFLHSTRLIESKTVGLPNLLTGRCFVPEMIQGRAHPKRIAQQAGSLLSDPERRARLRSDLRRVRAELGEGGAVEKAARIVLKQAAGKRGGVCGTDD